MLKKCDFCDLHNPLTEECRAAFGPACATASERFARYMTSAVKNGRTQTKNVNVKKIYYNKKKH